MNPEDMKPGVTYLVGGDPNNLHIEALDGPGIWWVRKKAGGAMTVVEVSDDRKIYVFGNDVSMTFEDAADPDEGFDFVSRCVYRPDAL